MNKKKSMYVKFAIDIVMAVTFVLFFNKRVLGGLAFHEIAGLLIAGVFFTHVLLNWKWVASITRKLFDRQIPWKTKFGYLLNVLLLITMAFIIISGIFISKVVFPDIDISNHRWFQFAHISISFFVLVLVAVHVGLHWQWIINVVKNIFNTKVPKRNVDVLANMPKENVGVLAKVPKQTVGILAKVAIVVLLVFGCYQMFATNFIGQLGRAVSVLTFSQSMPGGDGHFDGRGFPDSEGKFDGHRFPDENGSSYGNSFPDGYGASGRQSFPDGYGAYGGQSFPDGYGASDGNYYGSEGNNGQYNFPEGRFNEGKEGLNQDERRFDRSDRFRSGKGQFERRGFPEGDFGARGEQFDQFTVGDFEGRGRDFEGRNGDFRGKGGHFESANAIGVIIRYFSIMSVFIIITFYIDKLLRRRKRERKIKSTSQSIQS